MSHALWSCGLVVLRCVNNMSLPKLKALSNRIEPQGGTPFSIDVVPATMLHVKITLLVTQEEHDHLCEKV